MSIDEKALEEAAQIWSKTLMGEFAIPWEQCGDLWKQDVIGQTRAAIEAYEAAKDYAGGCPSGLRIGSTEAEVRGHAGSNPAPPAPSEQPVGCSHRWRPIFNTTIDKCDYCGEEEPSVVRRHKQKSAPSVDLPPIEEIKPCPYVNGFSSNNDGVSYMLKRYPNYSDFILFEDGRPSRCFRFDSFAVPSPLARESGDDYIRGIFDLLKEEADKPTLTTEGFRLYVYKMCESALSKIKQIEGEKP